MTLEDILFDIDDMSQDYKEVGWDGYDALPITPQVVEKARAFAHFVWDKKLAEAIAVAPVASGGICFEWYWDKNHQLIAEVTPDGTLYYAWINGDYKHHEAVKLTLDASKELQELLYEIRP